MTAKGRNGREMRDGFKLTDAADYDVTVVPIERGRPVWERARVAKASDVIRGPADSEVRRCRCCGSVSVEVVADG